MALVLALKVGEDFYIQDDQVVVAAIASINEFTLLRVRDGKRLLVREGASTPLFKDVNVSVGARGQLGLARVAIEAPRSIMILTGDNYRKSKVR